MAGPHFTATLSPGLFPSAPDSPFLVGALLSLTCGTDPRPLPAAFPVPVHRPRRRVPPPRLWSQPCSSITCPAPPGLCQRQEEAGGAAGIRGTREGGPAAHRASRWSLAAAWGEPVLLCPSPLPAQSVPGSSSPSNEKALPVGKIQDKIVLEQPRRRAVITVSCAYSKHKTPVVFSP